MSQNTKPAVATGSYKGNPTISKVGKRNMKTSTRRPLYEDKATDWLRDHGLKMRLTLSNTKPAPWETAGDHYRITLSREATKGARLVFDFWGSQNDMIERRKLRPYSVLACLSSDVHTPETFEDFCAEFGETEDNRRALQTFRRADRFARRLRAFLTEEEIKTLSEIR